MTTFAMETSSGYVQAQGHNMVLTYKGTDTVRDFMTDFNTWPMCGHSLGTVQATLAVLQLAHHLVASIDQVQLLTFSLPCIFLWVGATYFEHLGLDQGLGFKHIGLNLCVEKPAMAWPHLMEGYMADFLALTMSTFMPSFPLGSCCALLHLH